MARQKNLDKEEILTKALERKGVKTTQEAVSTVQEEVLESTVGEQTPANVKVNEIPSVPYFVNQEGIKSKALADQETGNIYLFGAAMGANKLGVVGHETLHQTDVLDPVFNQSLKEENLAPVVAPGVTKVQTVNALLDYQGKHSTRDAPQQAEVLTGAEKLGLEMDLEAMTGEDSERLYNEALQRGRAIVADELYKIK